MNEIQRLRFKIAVIGDSQVGKTFLLKKFTRKGFDTEYDKTIGAQFFTYEEENEYERIRMLFWDIAGSDDFLFPRPSFFKESSAAIIVFSLEDNEMGRKSFNHIPEWHKEVMKYCGDIPVYVFANKVDLIDEDELDELRIKKMVEENNLRGYYVTSAVSGDSPIEAFNDIIEELYSRYKNIPSQKAIKKEKARRRKRRK